MNDTLKWIQLAGNGISRWQMIKIVLRLSIPAVMAEITSIAMQYIDAAMVGSLGAEASASIGLVSTTTWLIGGLCISAAMGFSVQIAQLIGAQREQDARNVFRQSLILVSIFGVLLSVLAMTISGALPRWLGGEESICADASGYFFLYACTLPASQLRQLAGGVLQCSGNMKTPSILNAALCLLDVVFNYFLIFPTRTITLFSNSYTMYGAGLGVKGAALGTAFAEVCIAVLMLLAVCTKSEKLALKHGGSWRIRRQCVKNAWRISLPAAFEHTAMCGAYVAATLIVVPLGTTAVAANSLAVTAESFCYMPGYGIGSAATTLIGQSIGANQQNLAKKFAWTSVALGMGLMLCTGIMMFFLAPFLFAILTPSMAVRALGTQILRIEVFAEPLYAASIVCAGALRGAGDTLFPSIISLFSMWGVRITLSIILAAHFGLQGVWIAMCIELCLRGILFLVRLRYGKWMEKRIQLS